VERLLSDLKGKETQHFLSSLEKKKKKRGGRPCFRPLSNIETQRAKKQQGEESNSVDLKKEGIKTERCIPPVRR